MKNWRNIYQTKIISAEQAAKVIRSGDRVVIGHACAEPQALAKALVDRANELKDVELVHLMPVVPAKYAQPGLEKSFRHNVIFVGSTIRKTLEDKRADFTPCLYSEVPRLFQENILPVDVALIQLAPPDEDGFCSYGVSVDHTKSVAECAKVVIAQINSLMPRTGGAKIHLAAINFIVEQDEDIVEFKPGKISEMEKAIGENVAGLIPDGATLQIGIGTIPDAILLFLKNKKDLGIHSEMFSDGVVGLAEAGVITNRKKNINTGKFVASFVMGTKRLYNFVNNNSDVELQSIDYTNDPYIVGQHENMISINSALQVDLMGQVNAEMIGTSQYSGVGGQVDFIRGASRAVNGKSIIAMPSTAAGGKASRIVMELDQGAAVTTSRNDVHYVVTEYGVANLRGKSLCERAQALIAISHPNFRANLSVQAEKLFINFNKL